MIVTYIADITPLLNEDVYALHYASVPLWRRDKADKIKFMKGKAQSIGVWALLEHALRETGASTKYPYNLSHSGKYVLCSLSDEPGEMKVGCDIETVKEGRLDIAGRFFCKGEYEAIRSITDKQKQIEQFYRYWVLKESFIKATRQGMKLALDSFEIGFDKDDKPYLVKQPPQYKERYYYREYNSIEGICAKIAVCTTEQRVEKKLRQLSLDVK